MLIIGQFKFLPKCYYIIIIKKSINKVKIVYNLQTRNIKVAFPFFGVKNVYIMSYNIQCINRISTGKQTCHNRRKLYRWCIRYHDNIKIVCNLKNLLSDLL